MHECNIQRVGGCQCDQIRYRITADPQEVYVCHCTNCRVQSASAFGISVIVSANSFALTKGEPRFYQWRNDSGNTTLGAFCPHCGTRLWHQDSNRPEFLSIKGGSLDTPPDLSGVTHIWTASKLPGVVIPEGAHCFSGEPD